MADPPGASASVVKAARKRLRKHESESAVKKLGELLRQGKLDHLGRGE